MALERWIERKEAVGNMAAAEEGRALLAKFGDEPLTDNVVISQEREPVLPSSEQPVMVRNFALGALKDLKRNHAVVFEPLETSLAKLVSAKRPFWYVTNRDNPDFMNLVSRPTQIAIFPDSKQFYVPESNNKTLARQKELLEVDLAEVVKKKMDIGGVEEVIDNVATHAGLVFAYFDKSNGKVRLHGRNYGFRYARTETPTVGSYVAIVGNLRADSGLRVGDWDAGDGDGDVWAVRLVVPAQE